MLVRAAVAVALAALLAARGARRGSLSARGAVAAFTLGVVHLSAGWAFGATLIAFYLSSSRLTRRRQELKAALDESCRAGGRRGAKQVLCAGAGGAAAAAAATAASAAGSQRLEAAAWAAFLAHYACACADTWASEVGMLSAAPPRLITRPSRRVPAGTHGGVTRLGLGAAAAGGAAMAAVLCCVAALSGEGAALAPPVSRALARLPAGLATAALQRLPGTAWLLLGVAAGLAGSCVDSLLGATLQWSGFCSKTGRAASAPGPGVQHVSGRAVLSNEGVNLLSAAFTSAGAAAVVAWLLA
ncbi:hypothetical protein HT031_000371 [Scenedesmus sp. PABB004]|nr:hypothetical protein HT031_000371 [Scenedesmus sp. PABB004]